MQQFKETFFQREFQDLNDLLQQLEQVKVQDTARLLEQFEQAFRSKISRIEKSRYNNLNKYLMNKFSTTRTLWPSFRAQSSYYDSSSRYTRQVLEQNYPHTDKLLQQLDQVFHDQVLGYKQVLTLIPNFRTKASH